MFILEIEIRMSFLLWVTVGRRDSRTSVYRSEEDRTDHGVSRSEADPVDRLFSSLKKTIYTPAGSDSGKGRDRWTGRRGDGETDSHGSKRSASLSGTSYSEIISLSI